MASTLEINETSSSLGAVPPAAGEPKWPTPAPLAGVKSRKKAIFGVESAKVAVGNGISRISSAKVALESRILASGAAGRALVEVLLRERQLAGGQAKRHDDLRAAHLGPSCMSCDDRVAGETVAETAAAVVMAALQDRPQALVIETSVVGGSQEEEAWALVLKQILSGPELRSWPGAVVVRTDEETPLIRSICRDRWSGADGWVGQEQLISDDLEIWEDVLGETPSRVSEEIMTQLLEDVNEVAHRFFSEDVVKKSRELGWILSLLVEPCEEDGPVRMCGFLCHRPPSSKHNDLYIARLAVPSAQHKGGQGGRLMHWILRKAAKMPISECSWVSLSALDTAVPFYERFGFFDLTCDDLSNPEHFQTWMEMPNHSIVPDTVVSDDKE